jgi:hypothetical protein
MQIYKYFFNSVKFPDNVFGFISIPLAISEEIEFGFIEINSIIFSFVVMIFDFYG